MEKGVVREEVGGGGKKEGGGGGGGGEVRWVQLNPPLKRMIFITSLVI